MRSGARALHLVLVVWTALLEGGASREFVEEKRQAQRREAERSGRASDVLLREVRQPDLTVDAPPWKRNPSAWSQRVPIAVLAMIGAAISTYMALYQWRLIDGVWDPFFATERVLDSSTSQTLHRWFRMPDAALGALAYLGDAVWGMAGSTRRWQYRPWMVILFGLDVIPLGIVSAILVVMQGAVVGSWCFLCLVTAAISLVLVPLAFDEVWATLVYLRKVHQKTKSRRELWNAFLGRPSRAAVEVALTRREKR